MFVNIQFKNMKILKFKYLFLIISFLFIASSCSSDDDSDGENNPHAENLKSLGTSAGDILSENIYTSLTVELAFPEGFRPLQETIDTFSIFLEERLNKPDGILFVETEIITPSVSTQTISEIREIEAEQRTQYTVGSDIAVFIYFTNAKSDSDTEISKTLGTAYYNTSMVVFEKTLRSVSTTQGFDLFLLEETTLQHEFGHVLGLVDLRDDDIHEGHEDPLHSNHCIVQNCLMYYESNSTQAFRKISSVPLLDPLCIEDLQAKGGK